MGGFLPPPAAAPAAGIPTYAFIVSTFGAGTLVYSSSALIGAAQFARTGVGAWTIDVSPLGIVPVSGNVATVATVLNSNNNTVTAQCDGVTLSGQMRQAGAATDLICSILMFGAG